MEARAMLNLELRQYVDRFGMAHPVTNLYDADGDETDDTATAVAFVAGGGGTWFAHRVDEFSAGASA